VLDGPKLAYSTPVLDAGVIDGVYQEEKQIMRRIVFVSLLVAILALCSVQAKADGFIALEGSDATTFHQDPVYTPELFKYLQGGSTLDVLVYNPAGTQVITQTGGVAVTYVTSLTGVDLSKYSGLYVESTGGCCTADSTALNGFGAAVNAFVAAGGNVSIENYVGGSYDGVVPGGAAPFGAIEGAGVSNGGVGGGPVCTDGETVTAFGVSKGFSQPPTDFCWSHQGYESSYWSPLGYESLIASSTAYTYGDGTGIGSSFLAFGGSLGTVGAPEPSNLVLLGFGLIALAGMKLKLQNA
jgi:hypothetical protein